MAKKLTKITITRDTKFAGETVKQGKIIEVTRQNENDVRAVVALGRAKPYAAGDEKIAKARSERDKKKSAAGADESEKNEK